MVFLAAKTPVLTPYSYRLSLNNSPLRTLRPDECIRNLPHVIFRCISLARFKITKRVFGPSLYPQLKKMKNIINKISAFKLVL